MDLKYCLLAMMVIIAGCSNGTSNLRSPYIGQEERKIKALPKEDLRALKRGSGTAFRGLAKPAELNGVPGPKHVLEASERLNLSEKQEKRIQNVFERMQKNAITTGQRLIEAEKKIDMFFSTGLKSEQELARRLNRSAEIYGRIRYIHLKSHLATSRILTTQQIREYNEIRGYSGQPCEDVPEGHDKQMWMQHNGCQ